MADEKKPEKKSGSLYRDKPKGEDKKPKSEGKKDEPAEKKGGEGEAESSPDEHTEMSLEERHAEQRKKLHEKHRNERRDMHGNHKHEHDQQFARHQLSATMATPSSRPSSAVPPLTMKALRTPFSARISSRLALTTRPP